MQRTLKAEKTELQIALIMISVFAVLVLLVILLQMATASQPSTPLLQTSETRDPSPPTNIRLTGSERYRAEACMGDYVCDEERGRRTGQ